MLEEAGLEHAHRLDVLDAGCGTGLCGVLVAPFARRLTGVDLSEGMLAHAKDKILEAELRMEAGAPGGAGLVVRAAKSLTQKTTTARGA